VHHIVPEADGGSNDIENAISLCARCHTEASHYNPSQPKGSKFRPDELRRFRDELWQLADEHQIGLLASGNVGVMPSTIQSSVINLEAKHRLSVFNSTTRPIAGVQVSVTVCEGSLHANELEFMPDDTTELVSILDGGAILDVGTAVLYGIDALGRETAIIDLRRIPASSEIGIAVRVPQAQAPVTLAVMVDGFSAEVPPLLSNSQGTFRPVQFHQEDITLYAGAVFFHERTVPIDTGLFTLDDEGNFTRV